MTIHCLILFLSILIDRLFGDPALLWRLIPHPVVWFGWVIKFADKTLNRKEWSDRTRLWLGWVTIIVLLALAGFLGGLIHIILFNLGWSGIIIEAIFASIFIAQKSLAQHVRAVFDAYTLNGLVGARKAVSMIVGRDTETLNETTVASSAIESLAENTSDGIVAPVLWFFILGLPGLLAYKMLNTADSMIGHINLQYRDFGYATAKLDDVANYIPARLTAFMTLVLLWLKLSNKLCQKYWHIIKLDAPQHRSPNAGWPETAFACALNICLSGPRFYQGKISQEPYLNEKGKQACVNDIPHALKFFYNMMNLLLIIVGFLLAMAYFFSL